MKKREWLHQDALTHASFPFNSTQARLQLLGFFISEEQRYPAPVEMLVQEEGGKRLRVSHAGYAHMLSPQYERDQREPELKAQPQASMQLGDIAYAVSPTHVLVGQGWQVRRALRQMIRINSVPPSAALRMMEYLHEQPREVLHARAYAAKGLDGYNNSRCWTDLRDKIRERDIKQGVKRSRPVLDVPPA